MAFTKGDSLTTRDGRAVVEESTSDHIIVRLIEGEREGEKITIPLAPTTKRTSTRVKGAGVGYRLPDPFLVKDEKAAFTIGFLVSHGSFDAEVPEKSFLQFERKYAGATGKPISSNDAHYSILHGGADKWGPELRIYMSEPAEGSDVLGFGSDVRIVTGTQLGQLRVNSNQLWWQLVQIGFRLGIEHDTELIRRKITVNLALAFDRGVTLP